MTRKEYDKVVAIIEKHMAVIYSYPTVQQIVLTTFGFSNVKEELKELVKEKEHD